MAKVVILNAPAGSGKDTIADILVESLGWRKGQFKTPMFAMGSAMLGISVDRFMELYNDREAKENPYDKLNGLTFREFFIKFSEEFIKPNLGQDAFGKVAEYTCGASCKPIVFSDGGFCDELVPMVEAGHDIHVFRLHREGYTFEGDSRDYLDDSHLYPTYDIDLIDGKPLTACYNIRSDLGEL